MEAEKATRSAGHTMLEVTATVLLGVATVESAWCAYQAALWNGEQARSIADANRNDFVSLHHTSLANRALMVDVTTFVGVLEASGRRDHQAAAFLRAHARPEFRPALEAWIGSVRAGELPADTPFARPQYRLTDEEKARRLQAIAEAAGQRAVLANKNGDTFVLHTVLLALALFFIGTSPNLRIPVMRSIVLGFGGLVLVGTTISIVRLPREKSPYAESQEADAQAAAAATPR